MFYIAIVIFLVVYALIVSERVHRTSVALVGAVLMVILGVLHQEHAFSAIDFNTIGLLLGMMIIVLITKQTGLFEYVAIKAAKVSKGDPVKILITLSLITALFSALLDNVTTVLLIVPVTFVIANNLKINPIPFLIAEIVLSNIGGAATLIGDPPNILIGSAAGLTFLDFLINLAPISMILSVVMVIFFRFIYRHKLKTTKKLQENIMKFDARSTIKDVPLLKKSLFVLGVTIFGFLIHGFVGLEPATIALFGASLLLIISKINPEKILEQVEWTTILFFIGLFILVAGIEEVGAIEYLANSVLDLTAGSPVAATLVILWGSAIFSAVVDNIPFVATMIPLVQELGASGMDVTNLWWALALGADLGGNGTLVGASANLVAAGLAEKAGYKLGFKEFLKIGMVSMFITMLITTVYVFIRYI
ncbi:MAG: ArsB/NhaD family transporter [bacterium]|nr:ArsB/NhaD family transporter [bacterium]